MFFIIELQSNNFESMKCRKCIELCLAHSKSSNTEIINEVEDTRVISCKKLGGGGRRVVTLSPA
jgi:hypothetical protein